MGALTCAGWGSAAGVRELWEEAEAGLQTLACAWMSEPGAREREGVGMGAQTLGPVVWRWVRWTSELRPPAGRLL